MPYFIILLLVLLLLPLPLLIIIIIIKGHSVQRACLQPATNTQTGSLGPQYQTQKKERKNEKQNKMQYVRVTWQPLHGKIQGQKGREASSCAPYRSLLKELLIRPGRPESWLHFESSNSQSSALKSEF